MAQSKVTNGAWWNFSSVMMLMLIAGTVYGFGQFSPLFKDSDGYGLDQTSVETLGLLASLGNYIAIDSGILITRFGPVTAMAYGCTLACFGYLAVWASVTTFNGQLPYAVLCLFCFLYGHGCGAIDNSSMTQLLANFPDHKGNVVGCVKAYYGLASATVVIIYDALFAPNQASFILFIGAYSGVMGLIFIPITWYTCALVEESRSRVTMKFKVLACSLLAAALYFLVISLSAPKISAMPNQGRSLWLAILLSVFVGVASIFLLPRKVDTALTSGEDEAAVNTHVVPPRDVTGVQMLTYLDFYVLIFVLIVGQGSGLLFLNNSAQILYAELGKKDDTAKTSFIAMLSCFNCLGRLAYGNLSEALVGKIHRTYFLVCSVAILSFSYFFLFLVGLPAVWPVGALVGFAYGGLWGVQPCIVTEVFGPREYGFKYSCSVFAAAVGALCFGTLLAGILYDREAERLQTAPDCLRPSCYDTAFLVTACLGLPAVVLAFGFVVRTRWIYQALLQPPA